MTTHSTLRSVTAPRAPSKGRPYLLTAGQERTVAEYQAHLRASGLCADKADVWGGRAFFAKFSDVQGWHALDLGQQLEVNVKISRFVVWLIATQHLVPTAEYVVAHRPLLGRVMRRAGPEFYVAFEATAGALGFNATVVAKQWAALAQVAAVVGKRPQDLSHVELDAARAALCGAGGDLGRGPMRTLRAALFGAEAVLFHVGSPTSCPAGAFPTAPPNERSSGQPSRPPRRSW
jgi:hypothetical protein